jgi:soluble lytic murein transglycosylase-like protein
MTRLIVAALAAVAVPAAALAPVEALPRPIPMLAAPPEIELVAFRISLRIEETIAAFIQRVNPDVPAGRADALATAIVEVSRARDLDPLLLTGIIAQESHFHADLQSCNAGFCDLGVAQINWQTWAHELRLDRQRLIHDDAYNIEMAGEILVDTRARFGGEGPAWWTRYHDARPERRAEYAARVRSHAPVLLGAL